MKKIILFATLLLSLNTAFAQKIIGIEIPGLHTKDGKGEYDLAIQKATGMKVELTPPGRAFKEYEDCADCCISPANKNPDFYNYSSGHIASSPMFTAKIYIFSRPDQPVVEDLAVLKGKKVGIRIGLPYGNRIESSGGKFKKANKLVQNIKKLKSGRIDYMIAYVPDAYEAFEILKIEPFPHAKNAPIAVHEDSLLCKDNAINKKLIEKLNAGL